MKIKELFQNILLSLAAVLVFLIIFEIILRIYADKEPERIDPVILMKSNNSILSYGMKPSSSMIRNGINITINSRGMRDVEYDFKKKSDAYRIAVIGDSISAGVDLNFSDLYPEILEKKLSSYSAKKKYEVLNFGVNGYSTAQEVEVLKEKALMFEPDLVIIQYTLNDPIESDTIIGFFSQIEDKKTGDCRIQSIDVKIPCSLRKFIDNVKLVKFLHGGWLNIKSKFGDDFYTKLYSDKSNLESLSESFKEVNKISNKNDIKIVLVIFPVLYDLKSYKYEWIHSKITEEAEKNNFIAVDLIEYYKDYDDGELRAVKDDTWHPNRLGNEIAADSILEILINNKLI